MINAYLRTKYKAGARGPLEFDCWGIVRRARADLFGKPLLPIFSDAAPGNLRAIHKAFSALSPNMQAHSRPAVGAIAAAFRGKLCTHVGLVVEADGRLWILETDVATGPSLTRVGAFESRFSSVTYYND